jgi:DNA-binding NtrC family response regulator
MMADAEEGPAILVVDDEAGIRAGCQRVLQPQGYAVTVAASLREGREALATGQYAVVLLDVMLPDGQGIELLGSMLEMDPDVVPVIITGYATVELAVEAIRRGAYDFISKPFAGDVLLLAVNRALEKRTLSLETRRLRAVEAEAAERARAQAEAERAAGLQVEVCLHGGPRAAGAGGGGAEPAARAARRASGGDDGGAGRDTGAP